jgi:type 1 fimbria pilin
MNKNKIFLSVFVILLLTHSAFAASVNRTIEGNNFTYVGNLTVNITVVLTIDANSSMWGANETLPANVNVTLITGNADVIQKDAINYSFVSINGSILKYNITALSNATSGFYNISGWFRDSDYQNNLNNGTITNSSGTGNYTSIRIAPRNNETNLIERYNTNGNAGIQKDEAIDAVFDYFNQAISMADVLTVVRAYLGM